MPGVKGRSGRRKQPVEHLLRRGTLSPDDLTVVSAYVDEPPPEPTRPLSQAGTALWEWAWRHGGWLKPADSELLMLACEAMDERQVMRRTFLENIDERWRAGVMARKLDDQIKGYLVELGFSPAARAGMNLAVAATVDRVARAAALTGQRTATQEGGGVFVRNGDGSWQLEAG